MHKYFVYYTWASATQNGDGAVEIQRKDPITGIQDILDIQADIITRIKDVNPRTVIVANFRRFEEPE
jgi:hypothetical protein